MCHSHASLFTETDGLDTFPILGIFHGYESDKFAASSIAVELDEFWSRG
jgi:hypothetical protein